MAKVELKGIGKVYDGNVRAVDNANITIEDREFVVFVGPSGCGKSTTLRMVAGLEDITEGELYIDGELMNDVPPKIVTLQWFSKTMHCILTCPFTIIWHSVLNS